MDIFDMAVRHGPCGWTGRAADLFNPNEHQCASQMRRDLLRGLFRDPKLQGPINEKLDAEEKEEAHRCKK